MYVKLLHPDAQLPRKAYPGDAGFDVYAIEDHKLFPGDRHQFKLGIAIMIDKREVALMSERSGMAIKEGIFSLGNVIDSNYRGEISIILCNAGRHEYEIKKGDRIGQILILSLGLQEVIESYELPASERGEKAHTSSGK